MCFYLIISSSAYQYERRPYNGRQCCRCARNTFVYAKIIQLARLLFFVYFHWCGATDIVAGRRQQAAGSRQQLVGNNNKSKRSEYSYVEEHKTQL